MRAGKPRNEIEEIVSAIRIICPEIGFHRNNGTITLAGNDIEHLASVLDKLSKIENIQMLNKYGTKAYLTINISGDKTMPEGRNKREEICVIA